MTEKNDTHTKLWHLLQGMSSDQKTKVSKFFQDSRRRAVGEFCIELSKVATTEDEGEKIYVTSTDIMNTFHKLYPTPNE